jgi:hypothetical protein
MSDSWDEMRRAKEEQYFDVMNREALKRAQNRDQKKPRLSPISGKPMLEKTIAGVVVDVCPESGGIFLDAGELEQIVKNSQGDSGAGWLSSFVGGILGNKSIRS